MSRKRLRILVVWSVAFALSLLVTSVCTKPLTQQQQQRQERLLLDNAAGAATVFGRTRVLSETLKELQQLLGESVLAQTAEKRRLVAERAEIQPTLDYEITPLRSASARILGDFDATGDRDSSDSDAGSLSLPEAISNSNTVVNSDSYSRSTRRSQSLLQQGNNNNVNNNIDNGPNGPQHQLRHNKHNNNNNAANKAQSLQNGDAGEFSWTLDAKASMSYPSLQNTDQTVPGFGSAASTKSTNSAKVRSQQYQLAAEDVFGMGRAHETECPRQAGKHYMSCPSSHRRGYTVCISDKDLCDGILHCPGQEDEDPTSCLFYKTFHRYFKMVMDSLTELTDIVAYKHSEL